MSMASMAALFFKQTVTKSSRTGTGSKMDPAYGSQSTFLARVEKKRTMVRSASGEHVLTSHVMACTTDVKLDDRVWFPAIAGESADDTSSVAASRSPVAVDAAAAMDGSYLYQVYF
jgi:hypothetical protein